MRAFEYASPLTKEDAVRLLGEKPGEAAVLAGGTDLLSLMKDDVVAPSRLVNIKALGELRGIGPAPGSGLRIGALVTLDELLADAVVASEYPALVEAAAGVRSMQLRSVGTVGGELCQRPRCWYYRAGFGLLASDGGRELVPAGDNRYHAILGGGPAYFVSPSSLAPALIALGARVRLFGPGGERELELAAFYRAPRSADEKEYDLAADEIVTEVVVPPAEGRRSATYEVRQRQGLDWPLAAASVSFGHSGGNVRDPRIVLGHVAPLPWLASEASAWLDGKAPDAAHAGEAAERALAGARPLSMNAYKVRLAQVAVKRAVLRALGEEVSSHGH
jgi:xanthine dehydrogenase YagS FAD-binding subunit